MTTKHTLYWRDGNRYVQNIQTGDTYTYEEWRTKQAELIAELRAQNDAFFNSPDQVERREYLEATSTPARSGEMRLTTATHSKLVNLLIADDFDYIKSNREGDGEAVLKSILRYGWTGFEKMTEEQLLEEAEARGIEVPWSHSYL